MIATGGGAVIDPRNRWALYRGRLPVWLDGRPESNPVRVATLIATAALERRESRGSHLRRDHPDPDPALEAAAPCRATSSAT